MEREYSAVCTNLSGEESQRQPTPGSTFSQRAGNATLRSFWCLSSSPFPVCEWVREMGLSKTIHNVSNAATIVPKCNCGVKIPLFLSAVYHLALACIEPCVPFCDPFSQYRESPLKLFAVRLHCHHLKSFGGVCKLGPSPCPPAPPCIDKQGKELRCKSLLLTSVCCGKLGGGQGKSSATTSDLMPLMGHRGGHEARPSAKWGHPWPAAQKVRP